MNISSFKFWTIVMLMACTYNAAAQIFTERVDFGNPDRVMFSIPKDFSYGGVPHLVLIDAVDENKVELYNDGLEVVKTITMKEGIPFNYDLTYQYEKRDVVSVNETSKDEFSRFASYEEFLAEQKVYNSNFDESCLIFKDLGNGVRRISCDYDKLEEFASGTRAYFSNVRMYFAYDYFGFSYPKVFFIENSEGVVGYTNVTYDVVYSDWVKDESKVVSCSADQNRIRLCNVNLNQGDGRADAYFELSQTLFNEDDKFEYLLPKYELSTKGNVSNASFDVYPDDGSESITTTRSTIVSAQKYLALEGFQVVAEDGIVVADIAFDNDFEGNIYLDCAYLISIGEFRYLAFDGYVSGREATVFYKIDSATSAINKVKTTTSSLVLNPTIVHRGAIVSVQLGDSNEGGSDIAVVSVSGALVQKYYVPAGQTSIKFRVNTSSGMYCVSRLQKNKPIETKKILVK